MGPSSFKNIKHNKCYRDQAVPRDQQVEHDGIEQTQAGRAGKHNNYCDGDGDHDYHHWNTILIDYQEQQRQHYPRMTQGDW